MNLPVWKRKSRIKNYNVLVEEDNDGIHFLHKIVPGKASESYGIEVAKLAGLPDELIENASLILKQLEKNKNTIDDTERRESSLTDRKNEEKKSQLSLFEEKKEEEYRLIIEKLLSKNIMQMTPLRQ